MSFLFPLLRKLKPFFPNVCVLNRNRFHNSPNFAPQSHITSKQFSTTFLVQNKQIATFEEVKSLKNNKKVLLIDVRELDELKETGVIPGSINIPLGDVEKALKNLPADKFKQVYSRDQPEKNTEIIFYCRIGKRSGAAQDTALKLGYTNVKNYVGSWLEWEEKNK